MAKIAAGPIAFILPSPPIESDQRSWTLAASSTAYIHMFTSSSCAKCNLKVMLYKYQRSWVAREKNPTNKQPTNQPQKDSFLLTSKCFKEFCLYLSFNSIDSLSVSFCLLILSVSTFKMNILLNVNKSFYFKSSWKREK